MTFNSWKFLLFYPTVLLLYFVLPKKTRPIMLLISSYFFYMCYQAELVFLIFGTTLVSYVASNLISRTDKKAPRRLLLGITLVVSLGVLFFYKYFNFLSGSLSSLITLFGGKASMPLLDLMLPVGISFYTFQTLSYVIDVYRGDIEPEHNFFYYALFVSFFPQLVAGPIERPGNLMPQLKEAHKFNSEDAKAGAVMMLLGFFKKICVADVISQYVNAVYNSAEERGAFAVIIATALFAVQIYCDFSGYTDIAIGCARIMGIRLMKNFDHPYSATTIKEFWGRWHISLSTWFKDYLYIPLGGSRCKKPRHLMNLFIVFLVSGLWHGAAWTFVIWGAIHGIYQIIGNLTAKPRDALIQKMGFSRDSLAVKIPRRIITFILVSFAWIFFRANSFGDALSLIRSLGNYSIPLGVALEDMGLVGPSLLLTIFSILTLIILDRAVIYGGEIRKESEFVTRGGAYILFAWIIVISWCLLLSKNMISTFIYFQF